MCEDCREEYANEDPTEPTAFTAEQLAPIQDMLYERHGAGCCLHIVLDDCNIDGSMAFSINRALREEHEGCLALALMLDKTSMYERYRLVFDFHPYRKTEHLPRLEYKPEKRMLLRKAVVSIGDDVNGWQDVTEMLDKMEYKAGDEDTKPTVFESEGYKEFMAGFQEGSFNAVGFYDVEHPSMQWGFQIVSTTAPTRRERIAAWIKKVFR